MTRETKSKTFVHRMSDSEYEKLKRAADKENLFMAEYVRNLINQQIKKDGK